MAPLFLFSSSHLGEGSSPERGNLSLERGLSAWARVGRDSVWVLFPSLSLDVCHMFNWITILKHELGEYVWVEWLMDYNWKVWHDFSMWHVWDGWLQKWHGIGMSNNVILIDGTWCWCGQDVIPRWLHGGASLVRT